jgi:hypothetical protein
VAYVAEINLAGAGAQFQQLWVRNMATGAVNVVTVTAGQLMSGNAHAPDMTSDATQIAYSFQAIPPAGAAGLPAEVYVAGPTAGCTCARPWTTSSGWVPAAGPTSRWRSWTPPG